jgi:hypothetical protein
VFFSFNHNITAVSMSSVLVSKMLLHLFVAQKQYMEHQIFKTDNDVGTAVKQWLQEKENYIFKQ